MSPLGTKWWRYGEMDNESKTHLWHKNEVNAQSAPMIDPGTGKPILIREIKFAFNPETIQKIRNKQIPAPTEQELFNSNWDQIRKMLWADGLVAIQENEFPPRINIRKKTYSIFITCQPRMGTMVNEKIHTIQDITKTPGQ